MQWNKLRGNLWPTTISILFHGALVAFVMMGWESSPQPITPKTPQYIEAKLVEMKPKAQPAAAKPEQVQKVDLTKQRRERELAEQRERERRAEQQRAEQQRKAEEKRRAEQERQKAEQARQREQERQRQLEQERQAERERLAEQERKQRQAAELEKALQAERGMVLEEEYASEAQSYTQAIKQRIEENWSRPTSARNNMQALLEIQLVPTGRVVSVSVVKSSGNAAFDRSAEQAVRQVEVFPEVKEMPPEVFERYYRRFNLLFNPQDLRQ